MLKPTFRMIARNWWPAAVWLGIIRLESTDLASSHNTSGLLFTILRFFDPHILRWKVWVLDSMLRKTGHFLGYAILSALVFIALRNTYRDRLQPVLKRAWGIYLRDYWRWDWMLIGMLATVITASADEIHQTFLYSRTGRWQDVVIDSSGAVVLQIALYIYSLRMVKRARQQPVPLELASTR